MQINADLSQRVVVDSEALPWAPSPLPGVERRMLERDGGEVARATTIVRFAPGSRFSAHTHGGGEEFLVLEGVFSDESGDFGPGAYVRNPPGSSHAPASAPGCTIFVKLRQMPADEREHVRIDTSDPSLWQDGAAGERVLPLVERGPERVRLLAFAPGSAPGTRVYPGGAEILVLEGSFADEAGNYRRGTWLRLPPGARHEPVFTEGCRWWLKEGHLLEPA
jgi:anti-sigma factor ChrR (cupin superfamily)